MIGFGVENLDDVLASLQEIGDILPPIIQSTSPFLRRVFLIDPDGRTRYADRKLK